MLTNFNNEPGITMKRTMLLLLVCALFGCSKPTDIVFGPEPLKQMAEQGDQFKKLSEEDRMLLVSYVGVSELGQKFGNRDAKPITGRTVGEVLTDARGWQEMVRAREAEKHKKDAETAALREKVIAEHKAAMEKINQTVTVAVTSKEILPQNYSISRIYDQLKLTYAVENKSDKPIRQLKGYLSVFDATGEKVGMLMLTFDEVIKAKSTLKTTTGSVWKIQRFDNGFIEKIADTPFEGMKTTFEIRAIAYVDGEVVKAPEIL